MSGDKQFVAGNAIALGEWRPKTRDCLVMGKHSQYMRWELANVKVTELLHSVQGTDHFAYTMQTLERSLPPALRHL